MTPGRLQMLAGARALDPRPAREVATVLTLPGVVHAELVAEPFDLVWIDLEHGALGRGQAQEMILGAQAAGAAALVRLGMARADGLVGPMLDAGADGIVVADIRGPEQAHDVAALMHRPPRGQRGYGPRRSALRQRTRRAQATTPQLWVQIESQAGVANAEDIARLEVVDAIVVGIADLSVDLGIPIGLTDPRLHDALWTVSGAAFRQRRRFGLAGPLQPIDALGDLLSTVSILVHSTDARLCAAAVDKAASDLRGSSSAEPSEQGVPSRG